MTDETTLEARVAELEAGMAEVVDYIESIEKASKKALEENVDQIYGVT